MFACVYGDDAHGRACATRRDRWLCRHLHLASLVFPCQIPPLLLGVPNSLARSESWSRSRSLRLCRPFSPLLSAACPHYPPRPSTCALTSNPAFYSGQTLSVIKARISAEMEEHLGEDAWAAQLLARLLQACCLCLRARAGWREGWGGGQEAREWGDGSELSGRRRKRRRARAEWACGKCSRGFILSS